jgi:Uma2 family endonuclease
MSTLPKPRLTVNEYLEIEEAADFKSEYHAGEMFAMSGAALNHNIIAMHIGAELDRQLRGRPCLVAGSDMRVYSPTTDLFTYAAVVVTCGEPKLFQKGRRTATLLNPTVIVEVLSPTTEAYDRGLKFEHYKSIDSVQEYLLVSSDRMSATLYRRPGAGPWQLFTFTTPDAAIELESCGCRLLLRDLYDKVEFSNLALRAGEPE